MLFSVSVENNGTADESAGYVVAIDLAKDITRGEPTASAGFTYSGSRNYSDNGSGCTMYMNKVTAALAKGAMISGRWSWQLASIDAI